MTYRIQFDDYSEKWGVVNEDGFYIVFSSSKEGAIRVMNDLNATV